MFPRRAGSACTFFMSGSQVGSLLVSSPGGGETTCYLEPTLVISRSDYLTATKYGANEDSVIVGSAPINFQIVMVDMMVLFALLQITKDKMSFPKKINQMLG